MKLILFILLFFISNTINANETAVNEVEVINLHESKSLDQMVLENLNNTSNEEEVVENPIENNDNEENKVEVKQIEAIKNNFIFNKEIEDLKSYFDNLQKINSKTLQKQIINFLEELNLNLEIEKDKDLFFLIVNYFKSI